MNLRIL